MFVRRLFACAVLAAGLSAAPVSAETLVIGAINENVKKELKRTEPLAAYLATELADAGVTAVETVVVPSSAALARAMQEGSVDLVFDSPLVAAKVARDAGSVPFVRRWKRGVASYHSVIMVPADSGIETVADLAGKRIGFQEPDSTSGFMLPAGIIRREGLAMRELATREETPGAQEVGYVFTGDDKNSLIWLYSGWLDAIATDPQRYDELDAAQPGTYRALARSIEVPRQVGVHRAGLDPALTERLAEVLIAMQQTDLGRETMEAFNETSQFDRFPEGAEATFAPIYELLDQLAELGVL